MGGAIIHADFSSFSVRGIIANDSLPWVLLNEATILTTGGVEEEKESVWINTDHVILFHPHVS